MASDYNTLSSSPIIKHIPGDLWPEILRRIPVKTLMKFQRVCRQWKSILSSRYFVDDHFNSITSTTDQQPAFLKLNERSTTYYKQAAYDLHHPDDTVTTAELQSLQSNHIMTTTDVINGVVCLGYNLNKHPCFPQYIAFWNPSVRKYVSTPLPVESDNPGGFNLIGFGFAKSNNDFKAVWISAKKIYYRVFSARDGQWGRKKKLPEFVSSLLLIERTYGFHNCFVNGKIHWLISTNLRFEIGGWKLENSVYEWRVKRGRPHGLLVFDCEHEEFSEIDLPEQVWDLFGFPRPFVYGGLLAVLASRGRGYYELWTMKEYGIGIMSSWTKDEIIKDEDKASDYKHIDAPEIGMSAYVLEETMLLMDIGQSSSG